MRQKSRNTDKITTKIIANGLAVADTPELQHDTPEPCIISNNSELQHDSKVNTERHVQCPEQHAHNSNKNYRNTFSYQELAVVGTN